jgi:hypothetical protein
MRHKERENKVIKFRSKVLDDLNERERRGEGGMERGRGKRRDSCMAIFSPVEPKVRLV